MLNGIVRQLEATSEGDIPSERLGELVMEGLQAIDDVAYVRFASVYKNFREARDFEELLGGLGRRQEGLGPQEQELGPQHDVSEAQGASGENDLPGNRE